MFQTEHRLCCQAANMCVQAKDGFHGVRHGGEAVLGPYLSCYNTIQPEMHVGKHKLRPGSGCLTVKVVIDGPTRVLQIMDVSNQVRLMLSLLYYKIEWCSGLVYSVSRNSVYHSL